NDKKTFQRSRDDKNGKGDRKCFICGDPNHLIGECTKPPKDKNQRAFVGGSWSDNGEEDDKKVKDETCLVAQASREEEHPRCCQANGSKVKDRLVHLMMVVKFEVLIEKKKMCSLGLMRFDWWMEFLMVHLEELEMKKLF
ncbi:alpha/beta hydrolases superfamily protein, partial [Tanacetum coccineum]